MEGLRYSQILEHGLNLPTKHESGHVEVHIVSLTNA